MAWVDVAPRESPSDYREIELLVGEAGAIIGHVDTQRADSSVGLSLYVYPVEIWRLAQWESESWEKLGRSLAQGARVSDDGSFELRFLPTGSYIIACDETGFSEPVEVQAGYESESVIIRKH